MVARERPDARLLPRGGRSRTPLLALPRRPLRTRDRCAALVRAWDVCVRHQMTADALPYAELAVTTNFSFLRGASHPQEMVALADELGLAAFGIGDREGFACFVQDFDVCTQRNAVQF